MGREARFLCKLMPGKGHLSEVPPRAHDEVAFLVDYGWDLGWSALRTERLYNH